MTGMSQLVATCFALTAFTVALVAGLVADNPTYTVLVRSLIVLVVCYGLGWLVGCGMTRTLFAEPGGSQGSDKKQELSGTSSEASETDDNRMSSEVVEDEKVPAPL